MAADVVNDAFNLSSGAALNVLANDTTGAEVQTVSAVNFDYDPASVNKGTNQADWFIPTRAGSDVPQRSVIPGALVEEPDQLNFGDLDLWLDVDGSVDAADDVILDRTTGIVLSTLRENMAPASGSSSVNLSVVNYNSGGTGNVWLSTVAAPQNDGESMGRMSAALFPFADGWLGGAFSGSGVEHEAAVNSGITVTKVGTGRYEIAVEGVTDSYSDGFLFSIAGGNSDNYTHATPLGGDKWLLARRDNSSNISGGEDGDFNVLYIPRNSQGLIGGQVVGASSIPNSLSYSVGDFSIQRESTGTWRMTVDGHSPETGMLIMETADTTRGAPGNVYFSYEADGDDFLIRQLEGNTLNPLDDDFTVLFVPFENALAPASTLSHVDLGAPGDASSGVSTLGVALSWNADGTVHYDAAGAIQALGAGQTAIDTFVYSATDGTETNTATVTVNWVGANDAPTVEGTIATQVFNEDDAAVTFDLASLFADADLGDTLSYQIDPGLGGVLEGSIAGTTLTLGPAPDRFGVAYFTITAIDGSGASASITAGATVFSQDDGPRAVDDVAVTDKQTSIDIEVRQNDFHPETTEYSVSAANIDGNAAATGDGDTLWSVVGTSPSPGALTIQSPANLGDVAVGRDGADLTLAEGVFLGTVRDRTSPYQTVNTYNAFGSYGFATDTGISGGERNSPLGVGFFPFAEGWTSGHVAADGTLLGGVGITQANITKLGTGLWEITVPGMASNGAFFDDGMLFAMSGANNDNVMSVSPRVNGGWLVAQVDSDLDISGGGNYGGEDQAWSFVYIPGDTPNLIGGHYATGGFVLGKQYGGVTAVDNAGGTLLTVPGYTPADGAMIAISAEGIQVQNPPGVFTDVPAPKAVMATPDGDQFRIEAFNTGAYGATSENFYFVFLPFDQPLERLAGLDLDVSAVSGTSALGATVSLNADGTIRYNPSTGGAAIAGLEVGQTIEDVFTYTLSDNRNPAQTTTGTVTVTVTGENQAPVANNDTIWLNEFHANHALLTVLGNDTDPDFSAVYGVPVGIASANLSVDGSSNWSVAQTGTGANSITLGSNGLGEVELLDGSTPISRNDGVVLATIAQNDEGTPTDFRLVQAFENGTGGTSLAIGQFGADAAADGSVSLSYFRFADNWTGGHVDPLGNVLASNGLAATDVVRTAVGRYEITIPGITDSATAGFLLAIGNEQADNVISVSAIAGTDRYLLAVRDNQQDFADSEDGGFSFVYMPRQSENLVAAVVDPTSDAVNPVTLGVGEFTLQRQEVVSGGHEWNLTIPGQSPATGVLLLSTQGNADVEDNYLTYEDDGAGGFVIRSHDQPGMGLQDTPFSFTFVPFDSASQPVWRPTPDGLKVTGTSVTSALGAGLSVNADGSIVYSPGNLLDALYAGDSVVDTFTYTMEDGFGGASSATVTLNIAGTGAATPVIASGGSTYYALGDTPVSIDPAGVLSDGEIAFLDGAVLSVTQSGGGLATDLLVIRSVAGADVTVSGDEVSFQGVVIGTVAGNGTAGPLGVTFNAQATLGGAQAVLRAITFANNELTTPLSSRTFDIELVDGNGKSSGPATKGLELGLVRVRDLRQGLDNGYGAYSGAADIRLSQSTPDTPVPTDLWVDWHDEGSTNDSQILLRFDQIFGDGVGQIPSGAIITSAVLSLNMTNSGDGAQMHRLLSAFDADAATWNSTGDGVQADGVEARAEFDSQIGLLAGSGSSGTGIGSISVLEDLRAWATGEANHGWALLPWEGGTDGWQISSSEASDASQRPTLRIEWLPAGMQSASFRDGVDGYESTVDTELRDAEADTDKSAVETLFVDAPSPDTQTLLRFDDIIGNAIGRIPAGSTIVTAVLTLGSTSGNATGDGGQFFPMLTEWADTDTWNTLVDGISPDGVEAALNPSTVAGNSSRNPNVLGGFNTFDVTSDVTEWVAGQKENHGWAILPWASGTDGWAIRSSETPLLVERPRLEIYYIPADATAAEAVGSSVFYNDSSYSGTEAIAPDKQPYQPGDGVATYANYTNYSRGLNGVIVDVANLAGTPTVADFSFHVGNNQSLASWAEAPIPTSIEVQAGAGVDGSDRLRIVWPNNAIQNQWLEVTLLATPNTGLSADKVYYWGNQIGEMGNQSGSTAVNVEDTALIGVNFTGFVPAAIENKFDLNHDRAVNVVDYGLSQGHYTGFTSLVLLDIAATAAGSAATPVAAAPAVSDASTSALVAGWVPSVDGESNSLPTESPSSEPEFVGKSCSSAHALATGAPVGDSQTQSGVDAAEMWVMVGPQQLTEEEDSDSDQQHESNVDSIFAELERDGLA
ncbi:DNRLRE domain-containing protein [Aureliella helgolandensis]|nr:DNRLRE domain-containing protein [Aureliella helgolandensis]